jgi:hypothetical protein
MRDLDASALLARLEQIDVSPDLLRDVAIAAAGGLREPLQSLIFGIVARRESSGNRADIALAVKVRIMSLARLVREHALNEWVEEEDKNGIVLFHNNLFRAAATEPLILLADDNIGFDATSLRHRVLELTVVQGST